MAYVIALLAVILFLAVIFTVLGYVVFTITAARPDPAKKKPETEEIYIERIKRREADKQELFKSEHEDVSVRTHDGLTLRGWYFPSAQQTKRFVIFSHGHKCNGPDEFAHIVPFYLDELKYNVLLPDHRAHGRSDGEYMGFSVLDSRDILLWVDYLTARFGNDIEIIMHGASMGAATVMVANESDSIQPQVKLIVEDCGFSSAIDEIRYVTKDTIKLDIPLVTTIADMFCRKKAGYSLRDSDALKNIDKSKNPLLIVHGDSDKYVPTYMGENLYAACKSVPCEMLLVKGAIHVFSFYVDPEGYKAAVRSFIEKNISSGVRS